MKAMSPLLSNPITIKELKKESVQPKPKVKDLRYLIIKIKIIASTRCNVISINNYGLCSYGVVFPTYKAN